MKIYAHMYMYGFYNTVLSKRKDKRLYLQVKVRLHTHLTKWVVLTRTDDE